MIAIMESSNKNFKIAHINLFKKSEENMIDPTPSTKCATWTFESTNTLVTLHFSLFSVHFMYFQDFVPLHMLSHTCSVLISFPHALCLVGIDRSVSLPMLGQTVLITAALWYILLFFVCFSPLLLFLLPAGCF